MCRKEIDLEKKEEFYLYIYEPNIPTSIKKILQDSFPLYNHLYLRNREMVFIMIFKLQIDNFLELISKINPNVLKDDITIQDRLLVTLDYGYNNYIFKLVA